MTKVQKSKLSAFWLEESKRDLKAAHGLICTLKLYPNGLFFLHLSIEKALKSIYVDVRGKHAPLTHNLLYLTEECDLELPPQMKKALIVINQFNLSTRYPEEKHRIKKKFNKIFAERYLKIGSEIHKCLGAK